MRRQVHDIAFLDFWFHEWQYEGFVVGASVEADNGARIAGDNLENTLILYLRDVLMRDGESHVELAPFGSNFGKARSSEILELIDIDEEVPAIGLGNLGALIGRHPDERSEDGPEEGTLVFA